MPHLKHFRKTSAGVRCKNTSLCIKEQGFGSDNTTCITCLIMDTSEGRQRQIVGYVWAELSELGSKTGKTKMEVEKESKSREMGDAAWLQGKNKHIMNIRKQGKKRKKPQRDPLSVCLRWMSISITWFTFSSQSKQGQNKSQMPLWLQQFTESALKVTRKLFQAPIHSQETFQTVCTVKVHNATVTSHTSLCRTVTQDLLHGCCHLVFFFLPDATIFK